MTVRPRACFLGLVGPALDVRTFHAQARSLAAAGWDVTVIGRHDGGPATVDGIRIIPLPRVGGVGRGLLQARAVRAALAAAPDVIAITDVELLPAALLLKRLGRTVVYDCREDYPAYMRIKAWLPPRVRPLAGTLVDRLERIAARRLDAITTADEPTAARLRRYGGRVTVLFNFPRRSAFAAAEPAAAAHDVLYHGSLPPYVLAAIGGIATALARRLPDARWTIVGDPDAHAARLALQRLVAAAGCGERVSLVPRVPFTEVPALVQRARAGVVPLPDVEKFRSNLPMKLFEFLAAGVPVVASDLPPVRSVVGEDAGAVLVPPGDADAFAEALAGILRDRDRARALAERGRAAVRDRFHWEAQEPKLVRLWGDLLCGPGLAMEAMHA